jgi:hypothetical protein
MQLQECLAGLYPRPDQSISHIFKLLKINFNIILVSNLTANTEQNIKYGSQEVSIKTIFYEVGTWRQKDLC